MGRSRSGSIIAIIAAAAVVLAGCAGTDDDGDTPGPSGGAEGTSLTLGLVLEPLSLDFTTESGVAIPQVLLDNIYQTLVVQEQDGSIAPGLAESWRVSDDGLTYTFDLRDGVTFSDGKAFTATEAAFSINYVKSDWIVNVADAMDVVESAVAASPQQLVVTLSRPSNLWLFAMTTRIGAMLHPDHVDSLATQAIGTGPYLFSDWRHGESITLTRNEDYWGPAPAIDTVIFRYFSDPTAMNNALLTGSIQVITTVQTPQALAQFEDTDNYRIIEGTTNGKVMMAINNQRPPLDDLRVRRAINHALDKPALLRAAWAGYGQIIGSHEVPTDPWFVDLADRYPHDPATARELLADAGHPDLRLSLKIAAELPYAAAAASVVVSQLAEAGITVDAQTISWDSWIGHVFGGEHDYELTIVNHVEQYDVTTVFSGRDDYYTRYVNPTVTELEVDGDAADHDTFIDSYRQVMEILADDAAAAWLWAFPNLMVADADVHGLPENAIGESLDVSGLSLE